MTDASSLPARVVRGSRGQRRGRRALPFGAALGCCAAMLVESACTSSGGPAQDAGEQSQDARPRDSRWRDAAVHDAGGRITGHPHGDASVHDAAVHHPASLDASTHDASHEHLRDAGPADAWIKPLVDAALDAGGQSPVDAGEDAGEDAASALWSDPFPAVLSRTGLFADATLQQVAPGVRSFQPKFALWSDGATKRRWLSLPPGTRIDTSNMDAWNYPVGTKVWKEFTVGGVRVETRMLYKRGEGDWVMIGYAWRSDQSDADALPQGADNVAGTAHDIPAQTVCVRCHANFTDAVLGASALQLSHGLPGLTLTGLVKENLLTVPPSGAFQIPGGPLAEQALGYLHANCGHCHHPGSPVYQEILQRTPHTGGPVLWELTTALGSLQQTVGYLSTVGRPNSILPDLAVIEPGYPDKSELFIRISDRGPGSLQMPPIATEIVDDAGRAAIQAWISSLPPR